MHIPCIPTMSPHKPCKCDPHDVEIHPPKGDQKNWKIPRMDPWWSILPAIHDELQISVIIPKPYLVGAWGMLFLNQTSQPETRN